METKRDRFVRIVENRTNKIIDMLRLLGNCANKSNYDYTEADVQKIFNTLEKELKDLYGNLPREVNNIVLKRKYEIFCCARL